MDQIVEDSGGQGVVDYAAYPGQLTAPRVMGATVRLLALAAVLSLSVPLRGDVGGERINAVVKIFTVQSDPSFLQPWRNYQQTLTSGSGFVLPGRRIITNAHVVANQTFLQVRKQGDTKKYIARLLNVGHECDLAILTVDDPEFYRGITPLETGVLPELQDKVNVIGYPVGGDNIAVTEGVVSRIEPINYRHTGRELPAIQIDAAINPGNSGGPVLEDGKVVGVAFQGLSQAQGIGYMIPLNVLEHFLADVADGVYDGFPEFAPHIMPMENPDLRAWAGMRSGDTGVLVTYLPPPEQERGMLQVNDVIMAIDGVPIANDGSVPFRRDEVIFFETMIWQKKIGDICRMKIMRHGKVMTVDYRVVAGKKLVPRLNFDILPSYYLLGGLLFVPLSENYLNTWRDWRTNAPRQLAYVAEYGDITAARDQVVVLSEVLADESNQGYQNIRYQMVTTLNGVRIRNLRDLIERIAAIKSGFIELGFQEHFKIVLEVNRCRTATARIMARYRIPADRSSDLPSPGAAAAIMPLPAANPGTPPVKP
ncbi:MAG: serine protease [Victivallales bacterium]|nr:serine protease [Victivallales bacterium]